MSELPRLECTICSCDFDMEEEGGIAGDIGILPVQFCPTCLVGLEDMFDQLREDLGYDYQGHTHE